MILLGQVIKLLAEAEIPNCLIGAAALAAHGVARSTLDLDLLTTNERALDESLWLPLQDHDVEISVRRGDPDDPLAGVVRATAEGERAVDLIIGRFEWQQDVVERARPIGVQGVQVAVAAPADVVLLKLFAGGPQDLWDIQQLLATDDSGTLEKQVENGLELLPKECSTAWKDLRMR